MSRALAELSLSQLRCFVTVAEVGSFAEAGRRLGMSTSAMSKTIARLELSRGIKLIHRSTHALSLTEEGEALLDPARAAIVGLGAVEAVLSDMTAPDIGGRVRISTPVSFMRRRLVPLLPEFAAAHPTIHLDLRASNELVDLAADGIDIAIRGGTLDGLHAHLAQHWFTSPWVVCASPAYLARHGCPDKPDDLGGHQLIGFRNRHTGAVRPWRFCPGGGDAVTLQPNARYAIDDGESAWLAAGLGVGIAMVPLWLAADALVSGDMVEVLRDWRCEATQVSLIRRDRHHAQHRVEVVIAFLRNHTPHLPAQFMAPVASA